MAMSMTSWFQNMIDEFGALLWQGTIDTIYMTVISTVIAYVIGMPLGFISVITAKDGIHPMPILNKILGGIINIGRSIPFILLLVAIMPFTRWIVGTSLGPTAVIVPLTISAIPLVARLVEGSLLEMDKGVIEAARAMGASDWQIIRKVMLVEARPSLVLGVALSGITIVAYTAMAGAVGGGGLGDIAIRYGYYRSQTDIAIVTIVFLVIIVQIIQSAGQLLSNKMDKRKRGEK